MNSFRKHITEKGIQLNSYIIHSNINNYTDRINFYNYVLDYCFNLNFSLKIKISKFK